VTRAQLQAVASAQAQLAQKDWSSCMRTILDAMAKSEFAAGELTLAQCEDAGGLVVEATAHAKLALQHAATRGTPRWRGAPPIWPPGSRPTPGDHRRDAGLGR